MRENKHKAAGGEQCEKAEFEVLSAAKEVVEVEQMFTERRDGEHNGNQAEQKS